MSKNPFWKDYIEALKEESAAFQERLEKRDPQSQLNQADVEALLNLNQVLYLEKSQPKVAGFLPKVGTLEQAFKILLALAYEVFVEKSTPHLIFFQYFDLTLESQADVKDGCLPLRELKRWLKTRFYRGLDVARVNQIISSHWVCDLSLNLTGAVAKISNFTSKEHQVEAERFVYDLLSFFNELAGLSTHKGKGLKPFEMDAAHFEDIYKYSVERVIERDIRNIPELYHDVGRREYERYRAIFGDAVSAWRLVETGLGNVSEEASKQTLNQSCHEVFKKALIRRWMTQNPNSSEADGAAWFDCHRPYLRVETWESDSWELAAQPPKQSSQMTGAAQVAINEFYQAKCKAKLAKTLGGDAVEANRLFVHLHACFSANLSQGERIRGVYHFLEDAADELIGFKEPGRVLGLIVEELAERRRRACKRSVHLFCSTHTAFKAWISQLDQSDAWQLAIAMDAWLPQILKGVIKYQRQRDESGTPIRLAYHGPAHAYQMYRNAKKVLNKLNQRSPLIPGKAGSTELYMVMVAIAGASHDIVQHLGPLENEKASAAYLSAFLDKYIEEASPTIANLLKTHQIWFSKFWERVIVHGTLFNPSSKRTLADIINRLSVKHRLHQDGQKKQRVGYTDDLELLGTSVLSLNDTKSLLLAWALKRKPPKVRLSISPRMVGGIWEDNIVGKTMIAYAQTSSLPMPYEIFDVWHTLFSESVKMMLEIGAKFYGGSGQRFYRFMKYLMQELSGRDKVGPPQESIEGCMKVMMLHQVPSDPANADLECEQGRRELFITMCELLNLELQFARGMTRESFCQILKDHNQMVLPAYHLPGGDRQAYVGVQAAELWESFAKFMEYFIAQVLWPLIVTQRGHSQKSEDAWAHVMSQVAHMAANGPTQVALRDLADLKLLLAKSINEYTSRRIALQRQVGAFDGEALEKEQEKCWKALLSETDQFATQQKDLDLATCTVLEAFAEGQSAYPHFFARLDAQAKRIAALKYLTEIETHFRQTEEEIAFTVTPANSLAVSATPEGALLR